MHRLFIAASRHVVLFLCAISACSEPRPFHATGGAGGGEAGGGQATGGTSAAGAPGSGGIPAAAGGMPGTGSGGLPAPGAGGGTAGSSGGIAGVGGAGGLGGQAGHASTGGSAGGGGLSGSGERERHRGKPGDRWMQQRGRLLRQLPGLRVQPHLRGRHQPRRSERTLRGDLRCKRRLQEQERTDVYRDERRMHRGRDVFHGWILLHAVLWHRRDVCGLMRGPQRRQLSIPCRGVWSGELLRRQVRRSRHVQPGGVHDAGCSGLCREPRMLWQQLQGQLRGTGGLRSGVLLRQRLVCLSKSCRSGLLDSLGMLDQFVRRQVLRFVDHVHLPSTHRRESPEECRIRHRPLPLDHRLRRHRGLDQR